jgi:hypothetical protein
MGTAAFLASLSLALRFLSVAAFLRRCFAMAIRF